MQVNSKNTLKLDDFDAYSARRRDTSLPFKEDLFTDTINHSIEIKAPFFKDLQDPTQIYLFAIFLVETRDDLTFE